MPTIAGDRARMPAVSPGSTLTFGVSERADVRASDVEHRGLDGMAANVTTPRGEVRISYAAARAGQPVRICSPPPPSRPSLVLRSTAIADRAASVRPAAASRRAAAAARRHHADRRLLQFEPVCAQAIARDRWRGYRQRAKDRGARRDARARRPRDAAASRMRTRRRRGRAAPADYRRRRCRQGGLPTPLGTPGMPETSVVHVATSAEAAELAPKRIRPGDLVLVKGSRGIRTDTVVERLKVEFA